MDVSLQNDAVLLVLLPVMLVLVELIAAIFNSTFRK